MKALCAQAFFEGEKKRSQQTIKQHLNITLNAGKPFIEENIEELSYQIIRYAI